MLQAFLKSSLLIWTASLLHAAYWCSLSYTHWHRTPSQIETDNMLIIRVLHAGLLGFWLVIATLIYCVYYCINERRRSLDSSGSGRNSSNDQAQAKQSEGGIPQQQHSSSQWAPSYSISRFTSDAAKRNTYSSENPRTSTEQNEEFKDAPPPISYSKDAHKTQQQSSTLARCMQICSTEFTWISGLVITASAYVASEFLFAEALNRELEAVGSNPLSWVEVLPFFARTQYLAIAMVFIGACHFFFC